MIDARRSETLWRGAKKFQTPVYVYFLDDVIDRIVLLEQSFGGRFDVSFAVKANPNVAVLRWLLGHVAAFDVSSLTEAYRALAAGAEARTITFSGPGKRDEEIRRAANLGLGGLICESAEEAALADKYARAFGRVVDILIRINPLRVPKNFGVNMAGKPSQFGIDEEVMAPALERIARQENTRLIGFHIYSGTNCLNSEAIAENFSIFMELFDRACRQIDLVPEKLIFGSGFGIPYLPEESELDLAKVASLVNPLVDAFKRDERYRRTQCVLEMGRWLIGQAGYLLASVVSEKSSRSSSFRILDAGFNNQLSACGMMGTVIRRNWRISKVSQPLEPELPSDTYNLVGPLCTTIDLIASNIRLPALRRGDIVAIEGSGAYGPSASPSRFISHPEPREIIATQSGEFIDISESLLNHWPDWDIRRTETPRGRSEASA